MSRLTVYPEHDPAAPAVFAEPAAIAGELSRIGVLFERWDSPVVLSADDPAEVILQAYQPYLDFLMGEKRAGAADVIKMTPDHPSAGELRRKFLAEHTHSEDEIRFFVHGGGHFVMHVGGRVYDAFCEAGDLIAVPARVKHWFDAGPQPYFTALRVFTDCAGWVAHFTGDTISERFPIG